MTIKFSVSMSLLIFLLVLYVLIGVTLMPLFERAGRPGWKALVPGLRAIEWCKMIGRKPQFALWLLFPIVNIFIYAGMVIDMVRSFGKHQFWQAALAVIYAPIPFFLIGRDKNAQYEGPILDRERNYHREYAEALEKKDRLAQQRLEKEYAYLRKSQAREWTEAIVFAVFAAAFIRMFLIEAYVIPTSSMEGSLKVGDFLFVSKAHYGIRTPMTIVQFPLLHNRFPEDNSGPGGRARGIFRLLQLFGIKGESYLKKPSLPYFRLPGFENVERNKPTVFNWPVGDSVVILPDRSLDVYQLRRQMNGIIPPGTKVITRPVDKKDHYIKRCVAIAGDSVQIKNGQLYVNGQAAANPTHMQFCYRISPAVNQKKLEEFNVSVLDAGRNAAAQGYFMLDDAQVNKIRALGCTVDRVPQDRFPGYVFPNDPTRYGTWTVDDYGPIYIPKKGVTTPLNADNIAFYRRVIKNYEGNTLEEKNGKIYINGQEANSYTFQQDYYWMMGDNRHNSEDSRIWGYVPADHIVGKPLFIWFSTKQGSVANGINWDRIFKSANEM